MKVPIPNDWNGEDYQCVKIYWPNSPQFWGILNGLLTIMTRGRYWEENTGNIAAMQKTAWDIFDLNYPFVSCSDSPIPPVKPDDIKNHHPAGAYYEENEMPCIDLTGLIDIRNGSELWVRNSCCEWVLLGEFISKNETVPEDDNPIDDPNDPTQTYYPCAKVAGLIDAIADMLITGLDYYTSPLSFVGRVKGAVPGVSMSNSALYLLLFDFVTITKLVANDDIINDDLIQRIKCQAVLGVGSDSVVTRSEYDFVVAAIKNVIYANTSPSTTSDLIWTLWEQCYQTFSAEDGIMLMQLASEDATQTCQCPSEGGQTDPTVNGWYLGDYAEIVITSSGVYNTYGCVREIAHHDAYGCAVQATWTDAPTAGLVPTASTVAGCGAADATGWPTTSLQMQQSPQDTDFAAMVDSVADEVFGVGAYVSMQCDYESSVIASPGAVADSIVSHGFGARDLASGESVTIKLRFLHNINSPSHS